MHSGKCVWENCTIAAKEFEIFLFYVIADESDIEGTSPLTGKSPGSKKERHFWQYNVQSKGPKGQKISIQTKINDPHVLNEIVDPVFSGSVQLQGIKHRYINVDHLWRHLRVTRMRLPSRERDVFQYL